MCKRWARDALRCWFEKAKWSRNSRFLFSGFNSTKKHRVHIQAFNDNNSLKHFWILEILQKNQVSVLKWQKQTQLKLCRRSGSFTFSSCWSRGYTRLLPRTWTQHWPFRETDRQEERHGERQLPRFHRPRLWGKSFPASGVLSCSTAIGHWAPRHAHLSCLNSTMDLRRWIHLKDLSFNTLTGSDVIYGHFVHNQIYKDQPPKRRQNLKLPDWKFLSAMHSGTQCSFPLYFWSWMFLDHCHIICSNLSNRWVSWQSGDIFQQESATWTISQQQHI